MEMSRAAPNGIDHDEKHGWDSPAYEALNKHNLMRTDWRVKTYDELRLKMGNSSPEKVCLYRALAWLCPPCWWMNCFLKTAEVPAGSVRVHTTLIRGTHT